MKLDPYNHKEKYLKWKGRVIAKGIEGITKENSDKIINFIFDMELGLNVSSKSSKGSRSYIHLNNLRQRLRFLTKHLEERYEGVQLENVKEEMLFKLFNDMRTGQLRRIDGRVYLSTIDFVKIFKSFWHWHMKSSKKKGKLIEDITTDLDTSRDKPRWVYLTENQFQRLLNNASARLRVLMLFLYDTGIRSPTELMNVRVSDFYNDFAELEIREESSKTFGRRIKLMLCSEQIKDYILSKKLSKDDYVFKINYSSVNRSLKLLAKRILGEEKSPAGQKYSELTMYDFRHNACCYWLPRYKSESALLYRFGWKKSDKIHYYSELLGMKDTITKDDLLIDEKPVIKVNQISESSEKEDILQERILLMEQQMKQLIEIARQSNIPVNRQSYP